ncbi:MAG: insulinase family protein [Bacteroidales bacterium]|nr:insulinase family protein [Bacteroidales bacterium]
MPAQKLPPLQKDASITKGELSNGISYYLVTSPSMKGVADFALVRKGMTDTLAARAELASLPHFNKTIPYKFLSRKGIGCRPEGYVSFADDATLFRFDNVPMFDAAAADTTLLMMFDIIATQPRPHAVIVSGDIKPAEIIEKMKVFSLMVPSRSASFQAQPYSWTPAEETAWSFTPSTSSSVEVTFRSPRTPADQMNTIQPFISKIFSMELSDVVRNRLWETLFSRGIPVSDVALNYTGSSDTSGDERFVVKLEMSEEQIIPATMVLSYILAEIGSKGIGEDEYRTVREDALRILSGAGTNDDMVRQCISNYLFGSDLALSATKAKYFSTRNMPISSELGLFNNYISALLGDLDNAEVSWTGNPEEYDEWLYQTMFKATWNGVAMLDRPIYKWRVSAKDTTSLASDRNKTKLKSVSTEPVSGGEMWTFANGMRVIYKKMPTGGRFAYSMMIKGGFSTVKNLPRGEGAFFSDMMAHHRIAGFQAGDFGKVLKANGVDMEAKVSASDLRIYGSAPSGRYALVMKALLSVANDSKADFSDFGKARELELARLKPATLDSLMYPGNNYTEVKTPSGLTPSTLSDAGEFFSREFLRCGNGVIVIVGDIPSDALQKYLAKSVGGFRVSKSLTPRVAFALNLRTGTSRFSAGGTPSGFSIGMAASYPFSTESFMAFKIVGLSLSRKLSGVMAEYGFHVDLEDRFLTFPREVMDLRFTFTPVPSHGLPEGVGCGEDNLEKALAVAAKTIETVLSDPVSAVELSSCKALLSNEYSISLSDPSTYVDVILMRYSSGKDVLTNYTEKINGISADKVKDVLAGLSEGMRVEYVVKPGE